MSYREEVDMLMQNIYLDVTPAIPRPVRETRPGAHCLGVARDALIRF